ncbi:DUF3592 domain-containing protein [Halomontanus rarus]|uniref:DUF3592 domain-containing protein n=1 Tax=Halomontanus rarus TaxID=3034020 RepID=UPI0023E8CFA4|nr:DUF3592 domain-containing protein [Halovivax sp. TS33]
MVVAEMAISVRGTPIEITRGTVILVLVALAFATYGGYDYVQQSTAVDDAVSVEGTIVETSISQSDGRRSTSYHAHVEFTYQYQGTEYIGDQLFPGDISPSYDTRSEAESALEPYGSGATVTAYVDPAAPDEGFLERQSTQGPLVFVAIGGGMLFVTTFNAIGARRPGQGTELRPVREHESTRYRTLFGVDRSTVNRISTHLMAVALIVGPLSMVGVMGLLLVSNSGSDGDGSAQIQVGLSDPIGLLVVTAFVAAVVFLASVLLYGIWSFSEYRRLRDRIPEPRPPSPFKHPTRLVTILLGNYDLDTYGKRVQRTGFAFLVALFLVGAFARVLVF